MKKCSSCGLLVDNDAALFCTECGKPLVDADMPVSEPVNTEDVVIAESVPASDVYPESPAPQVSEVTPAPGASAAPAAPFTMPAAPAAPAVPAYNNGAPGAPYGQPQTRNIVALLDRNVEMASKSLASPWFIITAVSFILYTVFKILSIFYSYTGNNYVKNIDQYNWIFERMGISPQDIISSFEQYKNVSIVSSVFILIPMIITAIGLGIMISYGNKKPTPTAGITMAKTQAVFNIVLLCLAIIGMICACIASVIFAAEYSSGNTSSSIPLDPFGNPSGSAEIYGLYNNAFSGIFAGAMIFLTVIFVICFVMMLLYYAGIVKTLTALKKAGSEGKCPRNRVSIYVAVVNIIAAVYMMIMFIIDLIGVSDPMDFIPVATTALGMIFFFTSAISIFKLRDSLVVIPEVK